MPTLLIVDDEEAIRILLSRAAEHMGYGVITASTLEESFAVVDTESIDVAVVDGWLDDHRIRSCVSANPICERLTEKAIPFCRFSGQQPAEGDLIGSGWIVKPQLARVIMQKVAEMLAHDH